MTKLWVDWNKGKSKESDHTDALVNKQVTVVGQHLVNSQPTVSQRVGRILTLQQTRCVGFAWFWHVDPDSGAHTNTIEDNLPLKGCGLWSRRGLSGCGVPCMNTYQAAWMRSPGSRTSGKTEHSSSFWKTSLSSFYCSEIAIKSDSFRSHQLSL